MKLTSVYYSPELQRITTCSVDDVINLQHHFMQNMFLHYKYELIGYFYDN